MNELTTIGRAEVIALPDLGLKEVPAKIDTGADNSAIWVSQVEEKDGVLHCVFFGPDSPYYTGETVLFAKDYRITRIANSFGHKELRFKVKLRIRVKGRLIRATFTLSDRSLKTYPILLGRKLLKNKFVVDVALGKPLTAVEQQNFQTLQQDLAKLTHNKDTP